MEKPILLGGELNVHHYLAEKAKIYSRFQNGLPKVFDALKVEYAEPDAGWMDTTFYVNGEKKLEVSLSDVYNPLNDIIKWLEAVSVERCEELSWTLHLDCELGNHLIMCYEQLNYSGDEFGHFWVYGTWTEVEEYGEETVSVFCLKRDLINAIYTPLIKLWEGYLINKRYNALGEEDYQWDLSGGVVDSPQEIIDLIKSEKIENYLRKYYTDLR